MKFINKSDVEETTLSNYEGRLVRMEVYLLDKSVMLIAEEDGTVKEYDEDDFEQIKADADKVFAHYGDSCISVSVVETYEEEQLVRYIEECQISYIKNPLSNGQN
jgi:hypothetical protein